MTDMDMDDRNTVQETDVAGRKEWIRKRDVILCVVLIAAGIVCWLIIRHVLSPGDTAEVYIDGRLVQTIDMTVDDTYEFNTDMGSNQVMVESKKICVSEADCPDKICVNMGWKSMGGETITCLPHKLVIELHNDRKRDIDVQ